MKSLTSRQSATTGLIALGSILASFLIASVLAESASTQALTNANSDLLPRVLTVSNGKIAFGGEQTVSREVFVMNPDGSNETAITSLGGRDPAYSPDGTKIAFSSFRDFLPNNWSKLYVMNADGSNPVRLTNDANDEQTPSWSPDGTRIVFTRRDGTTGGNGEIYVIDANGSNQIRLTNDAADDDFASYSPDGTKIVFHSLRTGNYHVFIMNADGSSQTQLSTSITGKPEEGVPAWSPDGSKLAHLRGGVTIESFEIFVMNADGSNPIALTNNAFLEFGPTWSPDGAKLAFVGFPTDPNGRTGSIFTMDANGSNQVQLTDAYAKDGRISWESVATTPGPNTVQFGSSSYTVSETGPRVDITLSRSGDTTGSASVNYVSNDSAGLTNCNVFNGTASPRCDYIHTLGTMSFAAGETSKSFSIAIVDDSYAEGSETFTVGLNNPSGATLGAQSTATVTITDNESLNAANPIDNTNFFVRQQYIDFLNREPDPPGFAGWTSTINNCSGDTTQCDRVHVSQLFFQSEEFQSRGYFVYRFYPVAFGRKPDYAEFVPDLARVSGFLDANQLTAAKVAFITDFMARPAFTSQYSSLNNTAYVDALINTAAVNLPNRQALIDSLNNSTATRAQVLRQIVESSEVSTKYNHQAFAVMEYFGYLRRQPDALYLDWIKVLDQSNDPRGMVTGFVNSSEYRQRFGP